MSVEVSGVESVLARIAEIQAGLAARQPAAAPAAGRPAAVNTAFSAALSAASGGSALSANALSANGLSANGLSATTLSATTLSANALSANALLASGTSTGGTSAGLSDALLGSALPGFPAGLAGLGSGQPAGSDVVASAEKYLGVPYVFGGSTPSGLDCSGLVQRAYADLGISLPRIAADQAHAGAPVSSLALARPGDILAFGEPAHHVAIYLGNDMMIAAPEPGDKVKIQSVYETPTSIRRVIAPAGAPDLSGVGSVQATGQVSGLSRYAGVFSQNEARYQLPQGLLAAVAQTESGGNPVAVSPAGAQGLMQLMPATAQGLGVNPWEPAQAVQGAAQLLSKYLHSYGSIPLALAAYNAGPGAVEQYGGVPPFNETQKYVTKITALMAGRTG